MSDQVSPPGEPTQGMPGILVPEEGGFHAHMYLMQGFFDAETLKQKANHLDGLILLTPPVLSLLANRSAGDDRHWDIGD